MLRKGFILIALVHLCACTAASRLHINFINSSCIQTSYPDLCVQSLSSYAPVVRHSSKRLVHAALSMSAAKARSASTFVATLTQGGHKVNARESGAMQDCIQVVSDCGDKLGKACDEIFLMGHPGSGSYSYHFSNALTWASAALTDLDTCVQSLAQDRAAGGLRPAVAAKVLEVENVTKISLALLNRVAAGRD